MPLPVRVLVVDDEEPMLRAIERLMRGHGLEVFLEREHVRALDVIGDRRIEILVSDYVMPGTNGRKFISEAKRRHPGLCCVLMSGSAEHDVGNDALNAGEIDFFLEKPWPPGGLQTLLRELAAKVMLRRTQL